MRKLYVVFLVLAAMPRHALPAQLTASEAAEMRDQIATVEGELHQLPDLGAALYFLSTAKQQLGDTREALDLLKECLGTQEGFDPAGSPSLRALKGTATFDELVRRVHREFPVRARARLAFTVDQDGLVPEGFAFNEKRNLYYISSLNRGNIFQVNAEGKVSAFVAAGRYNLLPVLGLRVDSADGTVWAASWEEDKGNSELLHFDDSGALLGRYAPSDFDKHGFNDLIIIRGSEVIVTDSVANRIFRFDIRAHTFSPLAVHRALSGPNGIAVSSDCRSLFIADDFGIIHMDLKTSSSLDVNPGPRNTLAGVDGLYWNDGSLVAVQNGIGSPRIVSFELSSDRSHVARTIVLENRTAFTLHPTTGAIRAPFFYFISNSDVTDPGKGQDQNGPGVSPVRIAVVRLPSRR